jgi:hypothetical protein
MKKILQVFLFLVICLSMSIGPSYATIKNQTINDGETEWTLPNNIKAPKKGTCKNIKIKFRQVSFGYVSSALGIIDNSNMTVGYVSVTLGFPGNPRSGSKKMKVCAEAWKETEVFDLWGKSPAKKGTYNLVAETSDMNSELIIGQKFSSIKLK